MKLQSKNMPAHGKGLSIRNCTPREQRRPGWQVERVGVPMERGKALGNTGEELV
jgi:hypothetical protein